jgi:hypothetical protein
VGGRGCGGGNIVLDIARIVGPNGSMTGAAPEMYHWTSVVVVTTRAQDTHARVVVRRRFGGPIYVVTGSLRWAIGPIRSSANAERWSVPKLLPNLLSALMSGVRNFAPLRSSAASWRRATVPPAAGDLRVTGSGQEMARSGPSKSDRYVFGWVMRDRSATISKIAP